MILLDANILLRLADINDPSHPATQEAIRTHSLLQPLVIAPQSLFEFWAVATRAQSVNGLGMSIPSARAWIDLCLQRFRLLPEPASLVQAWAESGPQRHAVSGFFYAAHVARYVAFMQGHKISQFMTFNVKHFSAYQISIITPTLGMTSI